MNRAVLRHVGAAFISFALTVALYVTWMYVGTDWMTQRALDNNTEKATLSWGLPDDGLHAGTMRYDDPPIDPIPQEDATQFGLLYVPRWGDDYVRPIASGTDRVTVLNVYGIGHYDGTAAAGDLGNFALAGHRTTYSRPFFKMADLQVGDLVYVRTKSAYYVYRITETPFIISPYQIGVIDSTPTRDWVWHPGDTGDKRWITLTACHPWYSLAQRIVTHGEFVGWTSTSDGPPEAILDTVRHQPGMAQLLREADNGQQVHEDYDELTGRR